MVSWPWGPNLVHPGALREGPALAGTGRFTDSEPERACAGCLPVVGTVCGCDRSVRTVRDQPLEETACPKADGRPLGGAYVAAASIEVAHEHDVLPGNMPVGPGTVRVNRTHCP